MGSFEVVVKQSVAKDLQRVPKSHAAKVLGRIEALGANPRPRGAEKLSEQEKYRVREGIDRIIYEIKDDELTVVVVKVGHRRDVYETS